MNLRAISCKIDPTGNSILKCHFTLFFKKKYGIDFHYHFAVVAISLFMTSHYLETFLLLRCQCISISCLFTVSDHYHHYCYFLQLSHSISAYYTIAGDQDNQICADQTGEKREREKERKRMKTVQSVLETILFFYYKFIILFTTHAQ